jgi:metallo-beta-lactamase family protein
MRIEKIDGFSAHADEGELIDFIAAIPEKPQHVFVVHGEPEAAAAMAGALKKSGISKVSIPERGQEYRF